MCSDSVTVTLLHLHSCFFTSKCASGKKIQHTQRLPHQTAVTSLILSVVLLFKWDFIVTAGLCAEHSGGSYLRTVRRAAAGLCADDGGLHHVLPPVTSLWETLYRESLPRESLHAAEEGTAVCLSEPDSRVFFCSKSAVSFRLAALSIKLFIYF